MTALKDACLGSGLGLGSLSLRPHGRRCQMGVHLRGSCLSLERRPLALWGEFLQAHHLCIFHDTCEAVSKWSDS